MNQLRKSHERGYFQNEWLQSHHTFSFGEYFNRDFMGYRGLRVINEDRIQPGKGFEIHSHNNMEIISYVVKGGLAHKDSTGLGSELAPGHVQAMSAGSGIEHSEFNPSSDIENHFLQIWIKPNVLDVKPSYENRFFPSEKKLNKACLIASGDGRLDSLRIHQNVNLYSSILEAGSPLKMNLSRDRFVWVQVVSGRIEVGDLSLCAGDGLSMSDVEVLEIKSLNLSEILVFDLP